MDTEAFLQELLAPVNEFCRKLDVHPPAYCYIPLRTDAFAMGAQRLNFRPVFR
jgi:hypothetical protein